MLLAIGACAAPQKEPPAPAKTDPVAPAAASEEQPVEASTEVALEKPAHKEAPKLTIEVATATLAVARASLYESIAAIGAKNAGPKQMDRARADIATLGHALVSGQQFEAEDEDYKKAASEAGAELEKAKTDFDARWAVIGVQVQRAGIDLALRDATNAIRTTAQRNATEETFAKADAALVHVQETFDNGAALEPKDPNYGKLVTQKKTALEALKKQLADNRAKNAVYVQQDRVAKAKAAADAALNATKKLSANDDAVFAAADSAATAFEESLNAGKELEAKDAAYQKNVVALRTALEKTRADIGVQRARVKVAVQKTSVETARTNTKTSAAAATKTPDATTLEALQKSIGELSAALDAGKELEAGDKIYATYAATVTKEIATYNASLARLKGQANLSGLDAKLTTLGGGDEEIAAQEKALDEIAAALKAEEPLAASDKTFAAQLAQRQKKLEEQRAALVKKKNGQKIEAHRAEVAAQKVKVDEAVGALKGSLEHEKYQAAEETLSAFKKTLDAGETFASEDPKYAQELQGHRNVFTQQRMVIRRTRIEAASFAVSEKLKALEGPADAAAFKAAEEAVRTFSNTVDAAKSFDQPDKSYTALIATSEKQVPVYTATIEKKRVTAAVASSKATVEAAANAAAEAMKVIAADPKEELFDAAESAVSSLKSALDAVDSSATTDKAYQAYVASETKKVDVYKAQIETRRAAAAVAARRAEQATALAAVNEALKALAGEGGNEAGFAKAEEAIVAYEKELNRSDKTADNDAKYTKEVETAKGRIEPFRAQIEKRKTEVAIAVHRAKVEEAAKALAEGGEGAVDALDNAVGEGEALAAKDPKYAAYLNAEKKKIEPARAALAKKKAAEKVAAHRAEVDAAKKKVETSLEAIKNKLDHDLYKAAEQSVSDLRKVVEAGQEISEDDKKYEAELKAASVQVASYRMTIRRSRIEAAKVQVVETMKALDAEAKEAAFTDAEDAVDVFGKTVEAAKSFDQPDKSYSAFIAAQEKDVPVQRAAIEKRRVGIVVEKHRAKVEAALAAVNESLKGLAGEPEEVAFSAAESNVKELERALSAEDAVKADKTYAAYLEGHAKKIGGYRATITHRRAAVAVLAHKKERDAAALSMNEKLKAMNAEPSDASFDAANDAVAALEKVIESGAKAAEKDAKYGKELAAMKAKLGPSRAQIEKKKGEVALAAYRSKVEAANAELAKEPAEGPLGAFEEMLKEGETLAAKDKKLVPFLSAMQKKVPVYRATIDRVEAQAKIAEHSAKLAEEEQTVAEKIAALEGKLDHTLYQAAAEANAKLKKVAEAGDSLAEKDPSYGKRLAAVQNAVAQHWLTIKKRRVEAANNIAAGRMNVLEEKGDEGAFSAAEESLRDLANTIEAGQAAKSDDKPYNAFLASQEKQLNGYKNKIEKLRVSLVVDAHKAELEGAERALSEKMGALAAGGGEAAFDAAESAVTELERAVASGTEAGNKDVAYGKRLTAVSKKLDGYRATIEKRRGEAVASGHREKVNAASEAVAEKLGALSGKADESAFGAAEEAISQFEGVLKDGEEIAEKNKTYEKELAKERGKVGGFKARVAKRKFELERDEYTEQLEAAESSYSEAMAKLDGKASEGAFSGAEDAVASIEKQLEAGADFAKDKTVAKRLAAVKKELPKKRAAIARVKVLAEVKTNRDTVEAAVVEVDKRVGVLKDGPSPSMIRAAEGAVAELDKEIKAGAPFAKKSKEHAKWLAATASRIDDYRQEIGRRAVENEVRAHREKVEEAQSEVAASVKAVDGQLEYSLYQSAEGDVAKLRKIVDAGSELGEKDAEYGKELNAIGAQVDGYRVAIRRKWIEAAEGALKEKMGALEEGADDRAYRGVEEALRTLSNTADSGKALVGKDKSYNAFYAAVQKRVKTYRSSIDKQRSRAEFAGVRGELDIAVKDATAAMGALGEGEADAVSAADDALSTLEKAIDANQPAAEKDAAHRKRLAALKKKLAGDRKKVEKLRAGAETKPLIAKVDAAEATLASSMFALTRSADEDSISAVESAIEEAEGALEETKAIAAKNKAEKKRSAKLKGKIAAAKKAIKTKKGDAESGGAKGELEAAMASAKEAVGGLSKNPEPDAHRAAERSVEELNSAIENGKAFAKNKKIAKMLAAAKKASKGYTKTLAKRRPSPVTELASREESEEEPAEEATREDPSAKIVAAQASLKAAMKTLKATKTDEEDAITSAKASLDDLEGALADAKPLVKKNKALGKKVKAAKASLAKSRKTVAKREAAFEKKQAVLAKAEAKKSAKAAKLAASSASEESDEESEDSAQPAGDDEDPKARVTEAWASFAKSLKPLKKKKPTPAAFELALQRAAEVDTALVEADGTPVAKTAKFKKYAKTIQKKLRKERAKIEKGMKKLSARTPREDSDT